MASSTVDPLEVLYKNYDILSTAGPKAKEHTAEYQQILEQVGTSAQAKQLAAQFIPKFFKHFPALADKAINAQIDLCEDENVTIRIHAIKGFPLFCKDTPEHTIKIVDVLSQILVAEDAVELDVVKKSLTQLFDVDLKAVVAALCQQVISTNEDLMRDRTLSFLLSALNERIAQIRQDAALEEFIANEVKKIVVDVNGDEFRQILKFFFSLNRFKTPEHRHELLNIIVEQADLTTALTADDTEHIERLIACSTAGLAMANRGCSVSNIFLYYGQHVLRLILAGTVGEKHGLQFLQIFSDYSALSSLKDDDIKTVAPNLIAACKSFLPLPTDETPEPEVNFTNLEFLLFALYRTLLKVPELSFDDESFEKRLRYAMVAASNSLTQSRSVIKTLQAQPDSPEKQTNLKTAQKAIKVTPNIVAIAKELCKPAKARSQISLVPSWHEAQASTQKTSAKPVTKSTAPASTQKRAAEPTSNDPKKRPAIQGIYRPPSVRDGAKADAPIDPQKVPDNDNNYRKRRFRSNNGNQSTGRKKIVRKF